ncbi:MAG: hypothetical protein ACHP6I_02345 [Rickettsiales bacterium]
MARTLTYTSTGADGKPLTDGGLYQLNHKGEVVPAVADASGIYDVNKVFKYYSDPSYIDYIKINTDGTDQLNGTYAVYIDQDKDPERSPPPLPPPLPPKPKPTPAPVTSTTSESATGFKILDEAYAEFRNNQYYQDRDGKAHSNWNVSDQSPGAGGNARAAGNAWHATCCGVGLIANGACKMAGGSIKFVGEGLQKLSLLPTRAFKKAAEVTWEKAKETYEFATDYHSLLSYGDNGLLNTLKFAINAPWYAIQAVIRVPFLIASIALGITSGVARIAQGAFAVAALPIHALGTALKVAGTALDKAGSLAQTACAVVGNFGRVVAQGLSGGKEFKSSMAQLGGSITRLATDGLSIATEPLKSLGASIKDFGNALTNTKGIGGVLRGIGNVLNATATFADTSLSTLRKLATGHPKEAWEVLKGGGKAVKQNLNFGKTLTDSKGDNTTEAITSNVVVAANAGQKTSVGLSMKVGPDATPKTQAITDARADTKARI